MSGMHPDREGEADMRIDRDGRWYYRGSEIQRPRMVKVFASVLRRDPDGFYLVTPVEKLRIDVEEAPFLGVSMEVRGEGHNQQIAIASNVGDVVVVDATHPLRVVDQDNKPRPFVEVRAGLDALLSRPLYYQLVEISETLDDGTAGVWSAGSFFPLGSV
jgi:hypothetical protein